MKVDLGGIPNQELKEFAEEYIKPAAATLANRIDERVFHNRLYTTTDELNSWLIKLKINKSTIKIKKEYYPESAHLESIDSLKIEWV